MSQIWGLTLPKSTFQLPTVLVNLGAHQGQCCASSMPGRQRITWWNRGTGWKTYLHMQVKSTSVMILLNKLQSRLFTYVKELPNVKMANIAGGKIHCNINADVHETSGNSSVHEIIQTTTWRQTWWTRRRNTLWNICKASTGNGYICIRNSMKENFTHFAHCVVQIFWWKMEEEMVCFQHISKKKHQDFANTQSNEKEIGSYFAKKDEKGNVYSPAF